MLFEGLKKEVLKYEAKLADLAFIETELENTTDAKYLSCTSSIMSTLPLPITPTDTSWLESQGDSIPESTPEKKINNVDENDVLIVESCSFSDT